MIKQRSRHAAVAMLIVLAAGLAACTTIPTGPSHMALPGPGKDFDQFRADDASCRAYALESAGVSPTQAQDTSGVKSAVVGTAVGAAAGAAIGGHGRDAAVGAGVGLLAGALAGAAAGDQSAHAVQRRYDHGYTQCMYAKGHRVAVPAGMTYSAPVQAQPAPVAPTFVPPPPPGSAPPPPGSVVR